MKFDDEQKCVIEASPGSLLITAGPGAGKTAVLTQRIRFLGERLKIPYDKILVITFTKAAAVNMKDRFEKQWGFDLKVTFCTFHSLFYNILKDFKKLNFNVISRNEKLNILRTVALNEHFDLSNVDPGVFLDEISAFKNLNDSKKEGFVSQCMEKNEFLLLYNKIDKEMKNEGMYDFDDFSLIAKEVLNQDKKFLDKWRRRYDYCLIDEFQDINESQYDILRLLFSDKYVFAVGDEDQSIYSFRGSSIDISRRFLKDFDAELMFLETNYRSCKNVIKVSNRLINHNKDRIEKIIKPSADAKDGIFEIYKCQSINEEYDDLCQKIKKFKGKSMALLLRTNNVSDALLYHLLKNDICFSSDRSLINLKDNEYINDILSYFKIASGEYTYKNLLNICNKPNRYISRDFISKCKYSEKQGPERFTFKNLYVNAKKYEYLLPIIFKLEKNIINLKKMDSLDALIYVLNICDYKSFLLKREKNHQLIIDEMKDLCRKFESKEELIEYFKLINDENIHKKETYGNNEDCLEICTMHASKGREWDILFIVDVNEGNIPHRKALNEDEISEERRLFYVALTRAKEELYIYGVDDSIHTKTSLFFNELKNT